MLTNSKKSSSMMMTVKTSNENGQIRIQVPLIYKYWDTHAPSKFLFFLPQSVLRGRGRGVHVKNFLGHR